MGCFGPTNPIHEGPTTQLAGLEECAANVLWLISTEWYGSVQYSVVRVKETSFPCVVIPLVARASNDSLSTNQHSAVTVSLAPPFRYQTTVL